MSTTASVEHYIQAISEPELPNMFNPWSQNCNCDLHEDAYLQRRQRLKEHMSTAGIRYVLCGEAVGYAGAVHSGIPFTSERLLVQGAIPRVTDCLHGRLTTRKLPFSEPSATIVWSKLYELGIAEQTILTNSVPWHPVGKTGPHSNRTPTESEKEAGLAMLPLMLDIYPNAIIVAVGNIASENLTAIGIEHHKVRHPANGGATAFRDGLQHITSGRQ